MAEGGPLVTAVVPPVLPFPPVESPAPSGDAEVPAVPEVEEK